MSGSADRLRNLVENELGEASEKDVQARLDELDDLEAGLDDARLREHVEVLSTLAGDTRYLIVRLLAAADGDLAICELSPLVDVSYASVSRALGELADVGLVEGQKEGRWWYYETTERAERLLAALETEAFA